MFSNIITTFRQPASRRKWLTIASGGLIGLAWIGFYGLGLAAAWAPLMIVAALLAGADIAVRAWAALLRRQFSIELLVTVAAIGAIFIANYWEAAAVTFLFMLGAWLEMRTMSRTRGALKALVEAAPATATVLRDGEAVEVAAYEVRTGETVLVRAGQRLPVDGEVTLGTAAVNEAAIPASRSRRKNRPVPGSLPERWPKTACCNCAPPASGPIPRWPGSSPASKRRKRPGHRHSG